MVDPNNVDVFNPVVVMEETERLDPMTALFDTRDDTVAVECTVKLSAIRLPRLNVD
jgi:hypothetical protein